MSYYRHPPSINKLFADWFCVKCGALNFRRRLSCYRCSAPKADSEKSGCGWDEICLFPTKTIMLTNLDALTTEESVISTLNTLIPDLIPSIQNVRVGRDVLTSVSRGLCYLGMKTKSEATAIYEALSNLATPVVIDEKEVKISYCMYEMGDVSNPYSRETQEEPPPDVASSNVYTEKHIDSLADYAAQTYATTPQERSQLFKYYRKYFSKQLKELSVSQQNQMDATNTAAAIAQSAIEQMNSSRGNFVILPTGTDEKTYPVPDVSKYVQDESSGYKFDPTTGLYFDPKSNYYWNGVIQKYLYWDNEKKTYKLAPTESKENSSDSRETKKKRKTTGKPKDDEAKRIAIEMERWAKSFNQKKEQCDVKATAGTSSSSADVGFSFLEKNTASTAKEDEAVRGASPAEDFVVDVLDFAQLICTLCKRQFVSSEALLKHAQISAMHKDNLRDKQSEEDIAKKVVYRDRAKERRLKYGGDDGAEPNELKKKYLKTREEENIFSPITSQSLGSNNIGNRMLQKMGWVEGQGIGKQNLRNAVIETEKRNGRVGLGSGISSYHPEDSYRDRVKKVMYARYNELNNENSG